MLVHVRRPAVRTGIGLFLHQNTLGSHISVAVSQTRWNNTDNRAGGSENSKGERKREYQNAAAKFRIL